MNYYLKVTTEFGRGLYATNTIKKNKVIMQCEVLAFSEFDTVLINQTDLKFYTFKYEGKKDCLVLGDGEIFNHSDTANVGYVLQLVDDRKVMVFYALNDIKPEEQLFINYNADTEVNTDLYKDKNLF